MREAEHEATSRHDSASADRAQQGQADVVLIGYAADENLSLGYLASACRRAGFEAHVVPFDPRRSFDDAAVDHLVGAPVIGLSITFQDSARELIRFARLIRQRGHAGLTIAGGHFATLAVDELLTDVDAIDGVVRHEGEETLVELLAALRDGGTGDALQATAGLSYRDGDGQVVHNPRRPLPNLDSLAWPARQEPLQRIHGIPLATMMGSRGCYASCCYCSIHSWHLSAAGPRFRQRSVADVAAEMRWLRDEHDVRIFNFHDDNFFVPQPAANTARLRTLTHELDRLGVDDVALVLKCRPPDVTTDILDALAPFGPLRMYVGIENHSEQGLRSLGRAVTIDQNERALELVRERGLFAAFNLLLFDPDTTMGSLDANIGWLERCADVPFNFCTTQVYAGTPLESRLLAEGRLRGSYLGRVYAVADPRAEVMARLVNVAFHQRTLDHDGMAAQNMQLRLELEVLRRFHPEAVGAELVAAVHQFSRAFGIATAAHLRAAHRFVGGVSLRDGDAIRAFTVTLAKRIHHEDFDLLHDLRRLRKAMATPIAATPNRAR